MGYVVSFARFHERGLGVPAHPFVIGLLHWYDITLHHLNSNEIQHIVVFMAMCEGWLGIVPHFALWRYFFTIDVYQQPAGKKQRVAVPVGSANIHLRRSRAREYIPCQLTSSNKGWHADWFYLKNTAAPSLPQHRLPEFDLRVIETAPHSWGWGALVKERQQMEDHLAAIAFLRGQGLSAAAVIGGYH